jgi:hypothetical protein
MPTVKFDTILQEFSKRIGDRLASAFTPGGGAFPEGTVLAAVDAIAYVNKALHAYHGAIWESVQGDVQAFARYFPEMVTPPVTITFTAGLYTVANPNLNYFKIFGAYKSSTTIIRLEDENALPALFTGNYPLHPPTADKPILVAVRDKMYIFPNSETSANILFVTQPSNPTNGQFLTQNGTYDSPFYDSRNHVIATMAEQLYWNEKKPGGN